MGDFSSGSVATYQFLTFGGITGWHLVAIDDVDRNVTEVGLPNNLLTPDEEVSVTADGTFPPGSRYEYEGTYSYMNGGGSTFDFIVVRTFNTVGPSGQFYLFSVSDSASVEFPPLLEEANIVLEDTAIICFAEGSLIATPAGDRAVETLEIAADICTLDGQIIPVQWIGRQTVHKLFSGPHMQPVRIRAGALGDGLPHTDLTVTADHGMVIDQRVINAAALVNGTTIDFVPLGDLPDSVTYYHVETEHHDVILANGAPAETFVDMAGRSAFDNHQEYLDLYGAGRLLPEMDRPRIAAQRLVPDAIKARLGIVDRDARVDLGLTA